MSDVSREKRGAPRFERARRGANVYKKMGWHTRAENVKRGCADRIFLWESTDEGMRCAALFEKRDAGRRRG